VGAEKRVAAASLVEFQVDGAVDQREVCESLREVSQESMAVLVDLLGVEPDIVCLIQKTFEQAARLIRTAGAKQRIDQPEGADKEGTFLTGQAVIGVFEIVSQHVVAAAQ
jgi:hypothetical protein